MFPLASAIDINMIAIVLNVHKSDIMPGKVDDFSYQYYEYYTTYKGKSLRQPKNDSNYVYPAKLVVFDFDGTLTSSSSLLNVWEELWVMTGYSVNDCAKFISEFKREKISHKEWCDITLHKFRARNLSLSSVIDMAKDIALIEDVPEVLKFLFDKGISLHLLSGSIDVVISEVLGNSGRYFTTMRSNRMRFSPSGELAEIIGTRFDFQGKADYLTELIKKHDIHPYELLYIGNSMNDRFAHLSGARTLCVNPHLVDADDPKEWTHQIRKLSTFKEILPYVFTSSSDYAEI